MKWLDGTVFSPVLRDFQWEQEVVRWHFEGSCTGQLSIVWFLLQKRDNLSAVRERMCILLNLLFVLCWYCLGRIISQRLLHLCISVWIVIKMQWFPLISNSYRYFFLPVIEQKNKKNNQIYLNKKENGVGISPFACKKKKSNWNQSWKIMIRASSVALFVAPPFFEIAKRFYFTSKSCTMICYYQ